MFVETPAPPPSKLVLPNLDSGSLKLLSEVIIIFFTPVMFLFAAFATIFAFFLASCTAFCKDSVKELSISSRLNLTLPTLIVFFSFFS